MFENLTHITLSGVSVPIRCDIIVLEKIQDKYESITAFERLIYTFVPEYDADGNPVLDAAGNQLGSVTTPADLKALGDALVWMVQEGCAAARDNGDPHPDLKDPDKIKRMVDIPPYELSSILHDELIRCFRQKNVMTPPEGAGETGTTT